MSLNEEALYTSGGSDFHLWRRNVTQWLAVGLAHAAVIGMILQLSPQARQALDSVIHATIILPKPAVKPPEPPTPPPRQPKQNPARHPEPLLTAAPLPESPVPSFIVAETPPTPAPHDPAPPVPPVEAVPQPFIPPVFNADYLENPPPPYPPMSRRLGEKGRVLLRVFVSAGGHAELVEVKTSSGYERLDEAARSAVSDWRFVPARRGEKQVAAWVLVPISFVM